MAVKQVYVQGFGLVEVPSELQGDDLIRYANAEADRLSAVAAAVPAQPKPQQAKPSPGILSQAGAFLGSIPEGIAQGVGSTVSGIGALTTIDALKQAGQGISQFGEDISKELLDEEQRQSLGGAGGRLVGNLATYLTPGVFAKVAGLGGRAALGIGSAVSGLSGAGEQSQRIAEAREAGKQISEAEEAGLSALAGAGSAALEALPLGKMLGSPVAQKLPLVGRLFREAGELAPDVVKGIEKRFAGEAPDVAAVKIAEELARQKDSLIANLGTGARVKSALQAGALESPVEGLQNTLQNVITKYAYDPEQQITEGLKESLIAGGLGGTAIQGGIEIFQAKQAKSANERAMARAKREQSAPPVAPETAAQTTVFIDPVTGTQRVVDRETPKEKGVRKIEESIAQAGEVPEGIRGLLPSGGPVRDVNTRVGTVTVRSNATDEEIEQVVQEVEKSRIESEEAGRAAGRAYIEQEIEKQKSGFQKQLPPGGDYTQVVAPSGRMITLPAGATQQDIDFADKQLQELEEQTQRSNEASRLFYEKGLEIKAKKDLKDATKFVNQNPEVADTVFSQMGIESLADVEAKDIPTFVDLMLEETYKRQEKLTAANKNIQDNYPIASYLAREELNKSLGKLNDNQKLELSSLVDTQVQLNQKEYQDAVEEAEIRTAMGVEGSSVEPVDVRQKRAAQAIYGKPLEKLSTPSFFPSATPSVSELETVGKLVDEGDIRSLQITPEEMLERKQFEGMPFTTAKYRQVLDVLQANPDTPVTTNYIKETFDLPAPAANSMMALMRKRGDLKEELHKGRPKYFVEPQAEGPLYEMVEPTPQPQPTGEQLFNIAQTTTTQPEFDEKIAAQYAPDLVAALKKRKAEDLFLLGISNALLDAKGNVQPANGQYLNRVIYLAYSPEGKVRTKEDMIKTLDHEIIHGMKALNLFSDAEWKMLTTRFKISYLGEEREKAYRNRYASRKDLNSLLQEEAIAKAAADFSNVDPKRLDPVAKSLVKKVEAFLGFGRTAAQMGYASAEDVLAAVKSGEIGGRRFTPFYEQTITGKEISAPREIKIPAAGKVAEFVRPAPEPVATEKPKAAKGKIKQQKNKSTEKKDEAVEEALYAFLGENAYEADPIKSATMAYRKAAASQMEAEGKTPEQIRLATGWFKGPYDKKLRFEIEDKSARLTDDFLKMPSRSQGETDPYSAFGSITLAEALDHPELFDAYPELMNIKVFKLNDIDAMGFFVPDASAIIINPSQSAAQQRSTLMHEVQHWIQEKEGFASGGNNEVAVAFASDKLIKLTATSMQRRLNEDIRSLEDRVDFLTPVQTMLLSFKNEILDNSNTYSPYTGIRNLLPYAKSVLDLYGYKAGNRENQRFLAEQVLGAFKKIDSGDPFSAGPSDTYDDRVKKYISSRRYNLENEIATASDQRSILRGSNIQDIKRVLKKSPESWDLYNRLAGEIESRDVESRINFSPVRRKEITPFSSSLLKPEFAITYSGKGSPSSSKDIMYSLAEDEDSASSSSSVTPDGLVRAFSPRSKENLVDKIYNFFSVDRRSSFRQKFLDRYDPVKEWAIKAYEQTGDRKYLAAASGAYQALLFSDKAQDIAMAGLEFGGFSYDGSIFRAVENEKNSPIKLFGELAAMPASQSGFANKLEEFFEAAYARRYLDLAEGQNRDPGGVVKIEDVRRTWDAFKDDKVIDDAMKRFKAFNDNLIDVLRKSGFIDKKMAESWKQSYYIPFYRLPTVKTQDGDVETGEVDAPKVGTKATNLAAAKSLSGRNLRVNDAMENIIYNTYFMIGTAMKNVAGERIVRDGITTGYIKELPIDEKTKRRAKEDPGSNVISIRENGVKKFYQVDDPLVYDAVAKSTIPVQDALKMMGSFTTVLRRGVTTTPSFILKNPIRDTLQVWMQGGFGSDLTPPVGEYVKGITSVLQNSPEYRSLQGAGIAGSGIRTQNIASAAKSIREKIGVEQRAFYKKFYDILENAADKSEGISRVQAYKNALEKTGDEAEALFAAMETINFSRRGTSRGAQVAIALLPFFNARLQGLDVAYRTLKGDKMIPTELTGSSKKAVYTRMAYVSALSGVYAVLISGTKAWLNATDEERDSNIFVPIDWIPGIKEGTALKFPIPQELGLVTKMFPERLVSYYRGLDDGPELVDAMARGLLATLSMNPIPQIFRPYFEHTANFDMYTQKPIENAYLQRLLPEERYTEYTSEVYKMAGQAMGVSPVKLDHLIRGYTGSLGAMTADIIGMILEEGKAAPKPERIRFSEPYLLPGIGQLFRSANGRKAVEDLYELDEAANMAVATLRAVSRGQREMSPERQDELRSMLYIDKAIQPTLKRVQALNRMKRTVLAAEDMSPEQKRDELNSIQEEIVSLSSEIKDLKSELPLRFRVGLSKLLGF